MRRPNDVDGSGDDLLAFVKAGAHKVGQSVDIPSPLGRNMAGWGPVQFKLQPEAMVMLDQLREHPFFKGKWKTQAQVAWSMLYLGLTAVTKFLEEDWDGWSKYKSNYLAYSIAASEHNKVSRQEKLVATAHLFRKTIHSWLDKDTPFGKYMAWKTLVTALETRDVVEDVREFDVVMSSADRSQTIGQGLVFDNRAGALWERCVTSHGCEVDEDAKHLLYVELTTDYFLQLDAERAGREGVDETPDF